MTGQEAAEAAPLLRIVNPDATPEEVAAIVTVLAALGGGDAPAPRRPVSPWSSAAHRLRVAPAAGPGAWRASALPR